MGRKTRRQHIRAQTLEVARQKKAKDLQDHQIELEGELQGKRARVSLIDDDKTEQETYYEDSGHEPEAETLATTGVEEDEPEGEAKSEGSNTDTDLDKIIDCSIPTPIDVEIFASRLREAQCLAVKMRKGEGKRKTPRTYLGNSKKTQYRREKARKVLASKGFLSVASFMALKG